MKKRRVVEVQFKFRGCADTLSEVFQSEKEFTLWTIAWGKNIDIVRVTRKQIKVRENEVVCG